MQEVIVREGKDDPKMTVLLEEAVNSYTKNYMAGYKALGRELDANALRNHFLGSRRGQQHGQDLERHAPHGRHRPDTGSL